MSSEVIDMTGDSDDDCSRPRPFPPPPPSYPSQAQVQAQATRPATATGGTFRSTTNPYLTHNNIRSNNNDHCWKIVLLMDHREFNKTGFLEVVQQHINDHFQRTNRGRPGLNDNDNHSYCEMQALPSADYMFVARKYNKNTNTMADERVFDIIVERKNVTDLSRCLIEPSRRYKPLSFFEAQMYKLQHCGLPNKLFLLEGDEDCPSQFYHHEGNRAELEKMRKRVKTLRMQIDRGEYRGINILSTRNKDDTVQFLIDQMENFQRYFDPTEPPALTMERFKSTIDGHMKAPTFREYLRLRLNKGIGDKKAMKVIMDPEKNWDKTFISPACTSKATKSTLEDKATFYVSANGSATARIEGPTVGGAASSRSSARGRGRRQNTNTKRSAAQKREVDDSGTSARKKAALYSNSASGGGSRSSSGERKRPSPNYCQNIDRSSPLFNHPLHDINNSIAASLLFNSEELSPGGQARKPTTRPTKPASKSSRSSSTSKRRQKAKEAKKTFPVSSLPSPFYAHDPPLERNHRHQNENMIVNKPARMINTSAESSWKCTRCTFVNENIYFLVCEMCHEER